MSNGSIPGLGPVMVIVRLPEPELAEFDPNSSRQFVNLETLELVQSTDDGGPKEKPPAEFIDFRDLSDAKAEETFVRLHKSGLPQFIADSLRKYRKRKPA
jgi:hypothetical protein